MKYVFILITTFYTLLFSVVHAQNENWDTYMAKFGNKPGSVLVDMGLKETAPDKRYPYLVVTGPKAHNCNKQGLPDKEEISLLEDVLSATDNFINGVTAKVLTGTLTCNCERLNYYYVKDTIDIRNAIARMYNRAYSNFSYVVNIKYDPDWITYRTFLYPNEETLNWMENNKVISGMLEHGDSLKTMRDINFSLFFSADSSRVAVMTFAQHKGYNAIATMVPNTNAPYKLVLTKSGYIKNDFIDILTQELKEEAKKHHGFYMGWEAKNK